jgi:hypothetical protein
MLSDQGNERLRRIGPEAAFAQESNLLTAV